MNRLFQPSFLLQAAATIAKIIVFLLLPVYAISFMGFVLPLILNGYRLLNFGCVIVILFLIVYTLLLVMSLTGNRIAAITGGSISLLMEIIFCMLGAQVLKSGDVNMLLNMISTLLPNLQNVTDLTSLLASGLMKPGIGLIVNMILSVLYIAFAFLGNPTGSGRSNNHGHYSGRNVGSASSHPATSRRPSL